MEQSEYDVKDLVLDVYTDFGEPVKSLKNKSVFKLDLKPGFYQAVLSLALNDGTKVELDRTNLGFNPEQIVSEQDKQPDFDAFWENTLAQLAAVEMEPEYTLLEEHSNDIRKAYRVEMKSFGGETASGLLYLPVAEGKYPAMISYMGYGSDVYYPHPSDNPQMIEFQLCIRNQAFNRMPGEEGDWCVRGLEDKDTYYYRGAFADAVRAVDFICSLPQTDLTRVFANGESQGGALTLVAASLDHRIRAIAPSAPFLNDYKDYFALAHWPAEPILKAAKEKGISDEDLYRTLSYFDVKNFTDRIQCPVIMAIGLQDVTCPPHTNFAGYNHIRTEKSWICYPESGHNVWQQPGWPVAKQQFFDKYNH
jgi:cephalosporin-C deacetylase